MEAELDAVRTALNDARIEYALCGGLAVAVHGHPRSTIDIDLLIRADDESRLYDSVAPLGFHLKARPMSFDGGRMQIRRISKVDAGDGEVLMLDLLLVTGAYESVWDTREQRQWLNRPLTVVSREGLIELKRSRSSPQDLADIAALQQKA